MKKHKRKGRPVTAGSPRKPNKALETHNQVSAPIVPKPHPLVKWLEGLQPGTLFSTSRKMYTVTAVEPVNLGRMITLTVAHGLASNPPGVTHGGEM